jgi:DNA-binding NtrC family response regulator
MMRKSERAEATVLGSFRVDLYGGTIEHAASGRRLVIDKTPRIVGRSECDFRIDDSNVSLAHCELVATEHGVRLRDLSSRNGTFLNEARTTEAFITEPSTIVVGETKLQFKPGAPKSQALPSRFGELQSHSPRMQAVFEQLNRLAPMTVNVCLTGPTGTGKGYLARKIHERSKRANKPFETIDLGSIAHNLIESALFGHEQGAFTGANRAVVSPFVKAEGGTVFLDEVGELPLDLQKKLLRVLDEKIIQPLGSTRSRKVDVRIISATLRNLPEMMNRREFRDDLFERLGRRIELPALHERPEDMGLLIEQILSDQGRPELFKEISARTLNRLSRRAWEGNLRAVRGVLDFAIQAFDNGEAFDVEAALPGREGEAPSIARSSTSEPPLIDALMENGSTAADVRRTAQRLLLKKLHADCSGVVSEIARRAGVSRNLVRAELEQIGIETPESRRKGGRG